MAGAANQPILGPKSAVKWAAGEIKWYYCLTQASCIQ